MRTHQRITNRLRWSGGLLRRRASERFGSDEHVHSGGGRRERERGGRRRLGGGEQGRQGRRGRGEAGPERRVDHAPPIEQIRAPPPLGSSTSRRQRLVQRAFQRLQALAFGCLAIEQTCDVVALCRAVCRASQQCLPFVARRIDANAHRLHPSHVTYPAPLAPLPFCLVMLTSTSARNRVACR
jgi:hypothetical protein